MRPDPLVPAFYYYKFAEAISAPYTSLSAYSSGVIDSSGHIIKPESSIDPFEYFVIKLKKIFEQLPYGTTKASLASYIPALQMFSEEAQDYGMESDHFNYFVEGMVASESNGELSYLELVEEMGSGNLGGPAASNNTGGVSGYDPPMQKGVMKRKSILGFENSCEMFDVCPDDYEGIKSAKAWRHVPESESKSYLQRYQRRNGKGKMAIRNSDTGEVHFISMKPQSFMEEYGLEGLKIVNEQFNDIDILLEDKKAVTDIFNNLSNNVERIKNPGESKPVNGDREEQVAKMIHAIRSLHVSHRGGNSGVGEFIDTFHGLSKKGTTENGKDASELVLTPEGGVKKIDLDVKGLSTTVQQRVSADQQKEYGVHPLVQSLNASLKDAFHATQKGNEARVQSASREVDKQRKALSGALADIAPKISRSFSLDNDTRTKANKTLVSHVLDKLKLTDPTNMPSWTVVQPKSKKVSLSLTPKPTAADQEQVPAIVSGETLSKTLRNPEAFPGAWLSHRINKKAEGEESNEAPYAEVSARMHDISSQKRQAKLKTDAEELGTGHLVHADINKDMMDTLRHYIGHDDKLFTKVASYAKPFER